MLTKIVLDSVASFKSPSSLETSKKINLIYGLNGTGKSTISNLLINPSNPIYSKCIIDGLDTSTDILVYNLKFIEENFYSTEEQKGIFTLSKKNVAAEKELAKLSKLRSDQENTINEHRQNIVEIDNQISAATEELKDTLWEIKQKHSGGDRVLEYCFDGLKRKENLYNHLHSIKCPEEKPADTIASLKIEISNFSGDNSTPIPEIQPITYSDHDIVQHELWQKTIIGNNNSTLAEVISKLGNSDWVKSGKAYIKLENNNKNQLCPFCQTESITQSFIDQIKALFDDSYENDTNALENLRQKYEKTSQELSTPIISESPIYASQTSRIKNLISQARLVYEKNIMIINEKIKSPSNSVKIESLEGHINAVNDLVLEANTIIKDFNKKIANKNATLKEISNRFWKLMRWNYDGKINAVNASVSTKSIDKQHVEILLTQEITRLNETNGKIQEIQKTTVNINEAVTRIRNGLLDLGIDGFTIENHKDDLYRIVRPNSTNKTFHSLSEGEKMIISFLYFIELCRGLTDANSNPKKKVIVIDDPISSLSHIYVFNISQLIKSHFTHPKSLMSKYSS